MSLIAALLSSLVLSAPSDGLADLKPEDRADLQCMAVAALAGARAGDTGQGATSATMMYYYGRLQGRTPGVPWLQRFADYLRAEPTADMEANRVRCGQEVQALGRDFMALGRQLTGS